MKAYLAYLFLILPLCASPSSSGSYAISTSAMDSGGRRVTSGSYTTDASLGGIAAVASAGAPSVTVKSGYAGQLYDVVGMQLSANSSTVNESGGQQISSHLRFDDLTEFPLAASVVGWSVCSGPIGINASGFLTAGLTYQNTAARVTGSYGGISGFFDLTVIDSIADNFGIYAADGINDAWQTQYFGNDNPNAAPQLDADQDGWNNRFEFIAGLVPTDPDSAFRCRIERDASGFAKIIFSPRLPDRIYVVKTSSNLAVNVWFTHEGVVTDDGNERTVLDDVAPSGNKFYRVEISKP